MGVLRRVLGDPKAVDKLRKADEAMNASKAPAESDEYHRLNDAVIEARKAVPGWRRG